MTSGEGRKIMSDEWKAAFVTEAFEHETKSLEPLHPFMISTEDNQTIVKTIASQDDIDFFAKRFINDESDDEDEWEFYGMPLNNIFDITNDYMLQIFLQGRFLAKKDV